MILPLWEISTQPAVSRTDIWANGDLAVPELILFFIMMFAISRVNHQNKVYPIPTVFGKSLDPSPTAKGRRIALYALNALPMALSWTLIDMFTDVTGQTGGVTQAAVDFVSMFIVAFIVDTILNENRINKYNKYSAQLEAEENDLSD